MYTEISSVNWIILLLLSLLCWSKVIQYYCFFQKCLSTWRTTRSWWPRSRTGWTRPARSSSTSSPTRSLLTTFKKVIFPEPEKWRQLWSGQSRLKTIGGPRQNLNEGPLKTNLNRQPVIISFLLFYSLGNWMILLKKTNDVKIFALGPLWSWLN